MSQLNNTINKVRDNIFKNIHGNNLIYNTCWEDPRCDRKLLQLQADSEVVMITSAGDNALDYLLDLPAAIYAIDMNYRQNALLELKQSAFRNTDHDTLFDFFGKGAFSESKTIYKNQLRSNLSSSAQTYWDKHIDYFSGSGIRKSFYFRGASGILAYFCRNYIKLQKRLHHHAELLLQSKNIREQIEYYTQLEQKIFNPLTRAFLNNHYTMTLAGVPRAQQVLIQEGYEGGNIEYIQECLRNVFTKLKVEDNYFYQVYFYGSYTKDCCPEYLKAEHFNHLRNTQDRLSTHTNTLSGFLKDNPGQYSHYILLDHQDWLAAHDVPALEEEWQLILKNSRPGTRILMRSAASTIDFFPGFVKDKVRFEQGRTQQVHQEDRVGTYASVYLGIVQ